MIPAELYTRPYDAHEYHCAHWAVDLWKELTGEDISGHFIASLVPLDAAKVDRASLRRFKRVKAPSTPCIAIMRFPGMDTHMGIFVDNSIAQLTADGVTVLPVNIFPGEIRYYK